MLNNYELPIPAPRRQTETLSSAQFLPQPELTVVTAESDPLVPEVVVLKPDEYPGGPWSAQANAAEKARYDASRIGKMFAKLGSRVDQFSDWLGFCFIGFNSDTNKSPDKRW